jgi:hypothetical protein
LVLLEPLGAGSFAENEKDVKNRFHFLKHDKNHKAKRFESCCQKEFEIFSSLLCTLIDTN